MNVLDQCGTFISIPSDPINWESFSASSPGVSGLWYEPESRLSGPPYLAEVRPTPLGKSGSKPGLLGDLYRQMDTYESDFRAEIAKVVRSFVLQNQVEVEAMLREFRSLASLLLGMAEPLHAAFGADVFAEVEAIDVEDDRMLRVFVHWKGSYEDAEKALDRFDENHWLQHCSRANGRIVVNYGLF